MLLLAGVELGQADQRVQLTERHIERGTGTRASASAVLLTQWQAETDTKTAKAIHK